jgi:hypothetical protein
MSSHLTSALTALTHIVYLPPRYGNTHYSYCITQTSAGGSSHFHESQITMFRCKHNSFGWMEVRLQQQSTSARAYFCMRA